MAFDVLKNNVCRIICDKDNGTGFLISNKLVLTAFHVVKKYDENSIELVFENLKTSAKLHKAIDDKYKKMDIAILELTTEIDFYSHIDFKERLFSVGLPWSSRGYPRVTGDKGTNLHQADNKINDSFMKLKNNKFDLALDISKIFRSYEGLSGAPLVVENSIVGIINTELTECGEAKQLYGLSVKYFKELIDEVRKKEQKNDEIIGEIRESLGIELVKIELEDKTLYVGKYPVTFEEYDRFYDEKKDVLKLKKPKNTHFLNDRRGKYPVVNVNWYDAERYCNWIGEKIGIKCGLPPVEEWNIIVEKNKILDENIWHSKNIKKLQPIGLTEAGELGICDMYGNIQEWCYEQVLKGGTFLYTLKEIKENGSKPFLPNDTTELIGFRIFFEKY